MRICVFAHLRIYSFIHAYLRICVCVCVCVCLCVCVLIGITKQQVSAPASSAEDEGVYEYHLYAS
jgi:hypothetical protein